MITETRPNYEHKKLRHLLSAVFRSVWFDDSEHKMVLRDTYFMNFVTLFNYAEDNQLDKTEYFLRIRESLLASGGVHDEIPNLNIVELVKLAESRKINAAYYLNILLNKRIKTEKRAKELIEQIKYNEMKYMYGG